MGPPNRIQMVRTPDFKLARYFDGSPNDPTPAPDQGEFYDLRPGGEDYYPNDGESGAVVYNAPGPLEKRNLSDVGFTPPPLTSDQQDAYATLKNILQQETGPGGRLVTTPLQAPAAPDNLRVQVVRPAGDPTASPVVRVTFNARENTSYQVQKSTNLSTWSDAGTAIVGNNGLALYEESQGEPKAFYRIRWSALS